MIPAVPGAAFAVILILGLAALVALGLLGWWGWRRRCASRGRPRPPLKIWQWVLAVLLSILPIFALVTTAEMLWNHHQSELQQAEQDRAEIIAQNEVWRLENLALPAAA